MTPATTDRETLRQFFTNEVLKRVYYKDWRFGVRPLPIEFGGQFRSMGVEEQLVIYVPVTGEDHKHPEDRNFYQFHFWIYEHILDELEVYDAMKWLFETVIMHIERVFAEACFVYGSDRLMLSDDSIEVVRWHIVQRFAY